MTRREDVTFGQYRTAVERITRARADFQDATGEFPRAVEVRIYHLALRGIAAAHVVEQYPIAEDFDEACKILDGRALREFIGSDRV